MRETAVVVIMSSSAHDCVHTSRLTAVFVKVTRSVARPGGCKSPCVKAGGGLLVARWQDQSEGDSGTPAYVAHTIELPRQRKRGTANGWTEGKSTTSDQNSRGMRPVHSYLDGVLWGGGFWAADWFGRVISVGHRLCLSVHHWFFFRLFLRFDDTLSRSAKRRELACTRAAVFVASLGTALFIDCLLLHSPGMRKDILFFSVWKVTVRNTARTDYTTSCSRRERQHGDRGAAGGAYVHTS